MADGITDAIGQGAKEFVRIDPIMGFLFLLLLAAFVVLWRVLWARIKELEGELAKSVAARIADKDAIIAESRQDREFWEKMLDRADERIEKGRKA